MSTDSPILDKIMALVAPPQSATSRSASRKRGSQGNKEDHRGGHKKSGSGRMSNHEFCDSCREGGDLLCCDSCPAAFHFYCHDPPVDPAELPEGDWKCRKCANVNAPNNFKGFLREAAHNLNKSNSTQFSLPPSYAKNMIFPGDKRETAKMPNGQLSTMPPLTGHDKLYKDVVDRELCFYCNKNSRSGRLVLCDFCPLVFHLDCLDPPLTNVPTRLWMCPCHPHHLMEDFQHPRVTKRIEVMEMFRKPFDEETAKRKICYNVVKSNLLSDKNVYSFYVRPHPTDVPSSIRALYENPLPKGNTPSLLECLFTPKEQVLYIASEFDLKVPVPCGVPRTEENDEATRDLINSHLQPSSPLSPCTPPALAPVTVAEATAAEVTNDTRGDPLEALISDPDTGVDGDMLEAAYNLLKLRYAFQAYLNPQEYPPPNLTSDKPSTSLFPEIPPLAEILKAPDKPPPLPACMGGGKPMTSSKHGPSVKGKERGVKRTRNGYKTRSRGNVAEVADVAEVAEVAEVPEDSAGASQFGEKISETVETSESNTQPDDNLFQCSHYHKLLHGPDPAKTPKVRPLPISPDISKLDPKLVQFLALERLRQLLPDSHSLLSQNKDVTSTQDTASKDFYHSRPRPPEPNQPRGLLLPLTGRGLPLKLEANKMSIGTNSDMDINLTEYGRCGFVSGHHAKIFFDKITDRFELLNYSPYGTAVDRTLYGPDISKPIPGFPHEVPLFVSDVLAAKNGAEGDRGTKRSSLNRSKLWETSSVLFRTKSFLSSGNDVKFDREESVETTREEELLPQNTAEASVPLDSQLLLYDEAEPEFRCKCSLSRRNGSSVAGWEGNGMLRHGTEIAFGCISFVMSLTGYPGHSEISSLLKNIPEPIYNDSALCENT